MYAFGARGIAPTIRRALVALVAIAACLAVAAPAQAKSTVSMSVHPRSVHVGRNVLAVASAGSDSAGLYTVVCVERLTSYRGHHEWQHLRCSTAVTNYGQTATVRTSLRMTRPGHVALRAQLFWASSVHGALHAAQSTPATIVSVER